MIRQCLQAVGFFALSACLGLSDTALAQGVTITVNPQVLVFDSVPAGAVSASQAVNVTANPGPTTVQVVNAAPWIQVLPIILNVGETPAQLSVRVNATNLTPGTYQGSFTVALTGSPTPNQVTVNVQATVAGASLLSANPSSLNFAAQAGTGQSSPASTTVQIASSGGALNYTLLASQPWISLSTASGTTGGPGFSVSANPAGLTPGTYNGNILVESATTDDSVQISVTLVVNANATLGISPANPAPFLYRIGGAVPGAKFLSVTSSGGQVAFNVTQNPATNWLVVTPLSGSAGASPATLTLSVNPVGLSPGSYTTSLTVTPVGGSPLAPVPVRLVVSNNPILQLSQTTLSFSSAFGGSGPASQSVQVTATGGSIPFTVASDMSWLTATAAANSTDTTVSVNVNPSGLAIGTHTGTLTFTPTNGDQYTLTLPVSYVILDVSQLTAGPGALLFTHQPGQLAPQSQTVRLDSIGQPANFTLGATMTSCGQGWLIADESDDTTPAVITVSVNVTGLQAGVCTGSVTATFNSAGGEQTLAIPVTLAVSANPALRVSLPQGFGVVTVQEGQTAPSQSISLTSTDPLVPVMFNITSASTGGPWLLSPGAGSTPQTAPINYATSSLPPGVYNGSVNIDSDSLPNSMFTVPVMLRVLPNITVTATPANLVFTHPQGGPLPASQNVTLTSSAEGATFTATITQINGDWLELSRTSGNATGTIAFSIKQNTLPQNSYLARVRLAFQNASTQPLDITVILNVTAPRSINVSKTSLAFSYQSGSSAPAAQTFDVTGTGPASNFTVGVTSSGWLSATPSNGTTPQTVTASVNPQGLAAGTYNGSITVTASGVSGSPRTVAVTLTVTGPPAPEPSTIVNSASGLAGPVAPGELVTIKGAFLGPNTPAEFTVTQQNTIATTLSGVRVLFDNIPGTPLYVSTGQINVIAPYEIAGRLNVAVVVEYQGQRAAAITVQVAASAPGIFTANAQGFGQSAALNQDNSYNGPDNRAPVGTVLAVYATGGGQTNPPSTSHTVTSNSPLREFPNVSAKIGGVTAIVRFAGAAPGLVTGAIQVNLLPDPSVHGADLPVEITINGVASPGGPTVAVQ